MTGKSPGRLQYLFTTPKGLILVAAAILSVTAAIWATLSGPMVDWGVREITVNLLSMDLVQAEREGRIIMLYHSFAMIVTAMVVYLITALAPMDKVWAKWINGLVTLGYLLVVINGMVFAYFGHEWTLHGIYLVGMAIIFLVGLLLLVALWPGDKRFYLKEDSKLAKTKKGASWERFTIWWVVFVAVFSAAVGAYAGSYFANGFEAFLTEDTVRENDKTSQMKAVVGHLHIMLALIAIFIAIFIGRFFDIKGNWHKFTLIGYIIGAAFLGGGSNSVIVTEAAHIFVYVGAVFAMGGALVLVIYGMNKIFRDRLEERGLGKKRTGNRAGIVDGFRAMLGDPLKFGPLWMMIYMNFVTSFIGIFMAAFLEKIFRNQYWNHREERIELAGHWHALSLICAVILLMYMADRWNMKGKVRVIFGWALIIGSNIALMAMMWFEMKRIVVSEYMQQSVVNGIMVADMIGLGTVFVLLAGFMIWRLVDLLSKEGSWKTDVLVPNHQFLVSGTDVNDPKNVGELRSYRDLKDSSYFGF